MTEHAEVLSALTSVGLLAVWMFYAQLFYKGYKRQRRPRIIIDQMSGPGTESTCVLTNLSKEPVYLESVIAVARTGDSVLSATVTDHEPVSSVDQGEHQIVALMRQGPLSPTDLIAVGTIEDLARRAVESGGEADQLMAHLETLEVRVVATMSSEDNAIGAWKRFEVDFRPGRERCRPVRLGTKQMLTRKEKRQVNRWIAAR